MKCFNTTILIIVSILSLSGCSFFSQEARSYILGNKNAKTSWIYLSGLTQTIDSEQETHNRKLLDAIGKELNIRIIAVPSQFRCEYFDNKLCWPHETAQETTKTYNYILSYADTPIDGYIGFSNGGFFLHELMQLYPVKQHIITIGATGTVHKDSQIKAKSVTIIIGKKDEYHYTYALDFSEQLENVNVPVTVIEHDEGHIIPQNILEQALINLRQP